MKYLVIGHKFGALGRGGYHISKRFCDEHSEYCEFKEDRKSRNLEALTKKYKRIIFRTQVPRCYTIPVNFVRLRKINHLFYLRAKHLNPLYNNCTNGFHYYKMHKGFDNYIPMITDFPVQVSQPQEICLGFYVRKWLTLDSFFCFIDILDNLPYPINVTIMGDPNDGHTEFFFQSTDQIDNLGLNGHIKRCGRLIGNQQLRIATQAHGDHHTLAHAA